VAARTIFHPLDSALLSMIFLNSIWHPWARVFLGGLLAACLQAAGPAVGGDATTRAELPPAPSTPAAPPQPEAPTVAEVDGTDEGMKDPDDSENPAEVRQVGRHGKVGDNENDEIVGPGESRRINADESVEDLVVMLGKATVNGRVRGDLVVVGGKVTVNGTVDGSIACTGCRLVLGPNAVVRGDVGGFGKLEKRAGALIMGKEALKKGFTLRDAMSQTPKEWIDKLGPQARLFVTDHVFKARPLSLHLAWPWAALVIVGMVHVLTLLLFREPIAKTAGLVAARPMTTLLLGFVSLPLFLILTVVISGVTGCLGAPFLFLALALGLIVGKVAVELELGNRLLSPFRDPADPGVGAWETGSGKGPAVWTPFCLGATLLIIGYLVPYLGFGIWALATLWGLGAVLLFLFPQTSANPLTESPNPLAGDTTLNAAAAGFMKQSVSAGMPPAPQPSPSSASPYLPAVSESTLTPSAESLSAPGVELLAAGSAAVPAVATIVGSMAETPASTTPPPLHPRAPNPMGPTPPPLGASTLEKELWALPRAGLGVRLLALLIDVLVCGMMVSIVPRWLERIPFAHVLGAVGYFAGFWVWKGASVGGLLLGIRVVRLDGRIIDWQVAVVRSLASFLSLFSAGLGQFWCAWDRDQQTWQDKLAGTVVVKEERRRSLI